MTNITIDKLRKEFEGDEGTIVAVEDVSLAIEDEEFVVFVGPSGCGKTTTLRCIAGLEDVTSGEIHFGEEDVTGLRGRDRNVAMVFQNYALYPHMNVKENIGFGLKLTTKLSSEEIAERVNEVATVLGIENLLGQSPGELSGGQQQRVALGRAIVREPAVFLMDEPLSNLDAKLRDEMRTEIQQLQHDLGITTVYVTHDQTEAMAMGDRIAVMNNGRLQQIGRPEELYLDPVNEFVGGFIGSPGMNVFTAEVERSNNADVRLVGSGEFAYDLDDDTPLGDRSQVRVGIRPEDFAVVESGGNPVIVNVVEPMGDENYVYVESGDTELTARLDRTVRPAIGETINLGFDVADLYLFDADTGDALMTKTGEIGTGTELGGIDAAQPGASE